MYNKTFAVALAILMCSSVVMVGYLLGTAMFNAVPYYILVVMVVSVLASIVIIITAKIAM